MHVHLSEPDARRITRTMVHKLKSLGGHVTQFGVHLDAEGFFFVADLNGTRVGCRVAQGSVNYQAVAADMMAYVLSPPPETPLFPEATL